MRAMGLLLAREMVNVQLTSAGAFHTFHFGPGMSQLLSRTGCGTGGGSKTTRLAA